MTDRAKWQKMQEELDEKNREIGLLHLTNAQQKEKLDLAERRLAALAAEKVSITARFDTRLADNAHAIRESRIAN